MADDYKRYRSDAGDAAEQCGPLKVARSGVAILDRRRPLARRVYASCHRWEEARHSPGNGAAVNALLAFAEGQVMAINGHRRACLECPLLPRKRT